MTYTQKANNIKWHKVRFSSISLPFFSICNPLSFLKYFLCVCVCVFVCSRVLLKYKKGQRKLVTETSEGGWRVSHSLVLAWPYILLSDPLIQHAS